MCRDISQVHYLNTSYRVKILIAIPTAREPMGETCRIVWSSLCLGMEWSSTHSDDQSRDTYIYGTGSWKLNHKLFNVIDEERV